MVYGKWNVRYVNTSDMLMWVASLISLRVVVARLSFEGLVGPRMGMGPGKAANLPIAELL